MKRTALIAGAGIGGLSAAIALRQAGWHVRLFERAAAARELGFGLGVAPHAIAALRRLGVADVVLARGFAPTRGELRRMDGTVLKRLELPAADEVLGGPMVVALHPALHSRPPASTRSRSGAKSPGSRRTATGLQSEPHPATPPRATC